MARRWSDDVRSGFRVRRHRGRREGAAHGYRLSTVTFASACLLLPGPNPSLAAATILIVPPTVGGDPSLAGNDT